MRYIDLSKMDPTDPEVVAWERQARACLSELESSPDHTGRSTYLQRHNLWSSFKPILFRYFGEKCWYSECSLDGSFADVDHFRPKNLSVGTEGSVILDDGYWWLAYDYLNYRLSCEKCNRPYGEGGKGNYFPLRDGTAPAQHGEPCDEDYLLIDPCNAEDVGLIGFSEEGKIIPITNDPWQQKRVKNSIWIYNLNLFNNSRKRVLGRCKNEISRFDLAYYTKSQDMYGALQALLDLVSQDSAYSSVARQYISLSIEGKPYKTELEQILNLDAPPGYGSGGIQDLELAIAAR